MGHVTYSVTSGLQIGGSPHDNAEAATEVVLLTPTNLVDPQTPPLVAEESSVEGEMRTQEGGSTEPTDIRDDDYILLTSESSPQPQETPPDNSDEAQDT